MSGIAKAGEGYAEFIKSGEPMDNKVMKQLNNALKPALTDVRQLIEKSINTNISIYSFSF